MVIVLIHVIWKLLRKYCQAVTHELLHCSTVYTVILSSLLLLTPLTLLLTLYRPNNWNNMDIDWFKYNVIEQLPLGLEKLMEETVSIFWVDLGYRLRSRDTVPLQGLRGWLTSRIVHIIIVIIIVIDYLAVEPGSAPSDWVMVPGMYGTHLKHGQCLQPISFQNLRPWLTRVVGVV